MRGYCIINKVWSADETDTVDNDAEDFKRIQKCFSYLTSLSSSQRLPSPVFALFVCFLGVFGQAFLIPRMKII